MRQDLRFDEGCWKRRARWWGSSHRRAGAALLLVIAVACGDHGDDEANAPQSAPIPPTVEMPAACSGPEIALEDFSTCAAYANCARELRCEFRFDSLQDCLDHHPVTPRSNFTAAIARGTMTYDAQVAAACVRWQVDGECTTTSFPASCLQVFVGTLADDDPCYLDRECGRGGECVGCEPEECCQGTCFIPGETGEPCNEYGACAPGLVCDDAGQTCVAGPEPCRSDADCAAEQSCEGSGTCLDVVAAGETCFNYPPARQLTARPDYRDSSNCAPGLSCVDSVCIRTDYVGAPCNDYDHCWGGLQCRYDAAIGRDTDTCQPRSTIGEPCGEDIVCLGSSRCDDSTRRCVELSGRDGFCDYDWDCAGTLRCSYDEKRCRPPKPLGASCRHGADECDVGLRCGLDSTCVSSECPLAAAEPAPFAVISCSCAGTVSTMAEPGNPPARSFVCSS